MRSLALNMTQQRRLETLARAAGRTPQAMLRFVLRDGFDLCEMEVNESAVAEREARQLGYVSRDEARRPIKPPGGASGHWQRQLRHALEAAPPHAKHTRAAPHRAQQPSFRIPPTRTIRNRPEAQNATWPAGYVRHRGRAFQGGAAASW